MWEKKYAMNVRQSHRRVHHFIQSQSCNEERSREGKLHSNGHETIDFIRKVCYKSKKHDVSGLWQGWSPIIVFRAPAEFLLLSSYSGDSLHKGWVKKTKPKKNKLYLHPLQFSQGDKSCFWNQSRLRNSAHIQLWQICETLHTF